MGGEGGTVDNIGGEVGSIPPYPTFIPPGPKKLFCPHTFVIKWVTESSFSSKPSKHHYTQAVKARELKFWENVHPPPCVTCQVSSVRCHMSGVIYQVSGVIFWWQSDSPLSSSCTGLYSLTMVFALQWKYQSSNLNISQRLQNKYFI